MILYTLKDGNYIEYEDKLWEKQEKRRNVYVNLTNQCSCNCTFCLRATKEMRREKSLWLEREPEAAEVIAAFSCCDLTRIREIVFCGFGEPTMRLEVLLETARYLKQREPSVPIRVNTNGLSDLVYKKDTASLFADLVDTVSVSLNASNAEAYLRVTRNSFGLASYEAMLRFAEKCRQYVPQVVLTVVDCIGEAEIAACRSVCAAVGLQLRVRPFER